MVVEKEERVTKSRNVCRELFNYCTAVPRPLDLLVASMDQPRTELTVSRTYRIRSNRVRDEIISCDKKRGIKKYKIIRAHW